MPLPPEPEVTLPWLVRLRWLFLVGQAIALATSAYLALDLRWAPLCAALAAGVASNVALALWTRRRGGTAALTGGVLVLDTALLTAMLAAAGGATNPFTVLYLVHITLSAVVLSARWTTIVAALSVGGFALLFALPATPIHHHPGAGFDLHLQGMWAAFVLATALTAFFVGRITRAIAAQREQIAALREAGARNARLAALTTLAAGAAHELGSPLATIAVAAHEAHLGTRRIAGADARIVALGDDLRLILLEVERCQDILQQLAARSAQPDGDEALPLAELERRIRAQLGPERSERVDVRSASVDGRADAPLLLTAPAGPLVQSMAALIRNALEASGPDERVAVAIDASSRDVRISVEDRGAGIPGDVLGRVGEPFFTTKQPGRGMGLGVFLARAFFESRGGGLDIESTPAVGTRATVRLPRAVAP
jgi:two-component system sensor histidine kinase RegB